MAEVKQPVGEKEVFERLFAVVLSLGHAAVGVAAKGVGVGLQLISGGRLGATLTAFGTKALETVPEVQEAVGKRNFATGILGGGRFVKSLNPKPKSEGAGSDAVPQAAKPPPASGELPGRLARAEADLSAQRREPEVERTLTPLAQQAAEARRGCREIRQELDEEAKLQEAQRQQAAAAAAAQRQPGEPAEAQRVGHTPHPPR
jgi:hypothetical protein